MSSQLQLTWASIQRRSRWGLSRSKNVSSKFLKRPCKERYMVNNGSRQNFLPVSDEIANWCTTWLDQHEVKILGMIKQKVDRKYQWRILTWPDKGRGGGWGLLRPFEPQFGLKIRGALLDPPLRTTAEHFVHLIITQTKSHYLKKYKSMHIEFVSALSIFQGQKRNEFWREFFLTESIVNWLFFLKRIYQKQNTMAKVKTFVNRRTSFL